MRHQVDTKASRIGRTAQRGVRARLVNYVAALTVNAAIVLSVPRSTAINPAPMVLRFQGRLIDGRWHEGEYIDGERPAILVSPLDRRIGRLPEYPIILDN